MAAITASRPCGAIYIGSTRDVRRRVEPHRSGFKGRHTDRCNVRQLVWFETYPDFASAFTRERQMKEWKRAWKIKLIVAVNPEWRDVTADIPL